jgi:hypothetical protein
LREAINYVFAKKALRKIFGPKKNEVFSILNPTQKRK